MQVAVLDKIVQSKEMLTTALKDIVRTKRKRVLEASDIQEALSNLASSSSSSS
jgi:hypothetical protein